MYSKQLSVLALIGSALPAALAQRPNGTSICDYYTNAIFKDTSAEHEYLLLTKLVNTVVIGNYSACVATADPVPGILAPAYYAGEDVELAPYFNGCDNSTNTDNMSSVVNFLDGGGAGPLKMDKPANDTNSNQYTLLTHLYQYFGALLGCGQYNTAAFPAYMGDKSMADVHKFMALNAAQVGYFNSQVGAAALCFGVSVEDATAVGEELNTLFNYRCSPPVVIANISTDAYLNSICEDCSCPLDPNADCAAYSDAPNATGGCYTAPASLCAAPTMMAATTTTYVCGTSPTA